MHVVTQQVIAPPARAGMFLVITVDEGAEDAAAALLTEISGLTRSVAFRVPDDGLNCVIGIGAHLWDRLYGEDTRPLHLHPFQEIRGAKHTAPATEGDLLVHLRCREMGPCFELARIIARRLVGIGQVVDEVHGFKFFDERDLLGFVDGTENPEGDAAVAAVTVGEEDPAYAGGSYVIVQKYLHDMTSWDALSVEEQERVIGRSKLDDIEMADDVKPANAHITLNVIEDDEGNQLQILRDNMPFGEVGDGTSGTYFIGYAADPGVTERMLRNMFIGDPPGTYDRILDFSVAHTGALFFTPSIDFLDDPHPVARDATPAPDPAPSDGSLRIGSLHRRTRERGTR
ncbi:Dyp-type peroxidase [Calidifontibacter sp. DB0510]|uniref:Dyp-type peroxidase n=1 Tax=Metallococcus carri TaxID=1656884 RepID=A0A967E827_9MICO|nr:Dyp-type peroxidase [Metallococcus carri]NHN54782.1 Dyp-type peroxidase [Metallococcus carri]NOP37127.1 Dyp-type peroxidase [Calidifontibacter sp. DB2511S]